jgi:hypothetical protein
MDKYTKEKINAILEILPPIGESKFPGMTYEEGVEEVLMYLLGEVSDDEFPYAV